MRTLREYSSTIDCARRVDFLKNCGYDVYSVTETGIANTVKIEYRIEDDEEKTVATLHVDNEFKDILQRLDAWGAWLKNIKDYMEFYLSQDDKEERIKLLNKLFAEKDYRRVIRNSFVFSKTPEREIYWFEMSDSVWEEQHDDSLEFSI